MFVNQNAMGSIAGSSKRQNRFILPEITGV
jgi:hypothetical protein